MEIRSFVKGSEFAAAAVVLLTLAFAQDLEASSSAWAVLGFQETVLLADTLANAAVSAKGEIYARRSTKCAAPTLTVGDTSVNPSSTTKIDATGRVLFSVQIEGTGNGSKLVLDAGGNVFIAGFSASGFATTPGAYESITPGPLAKSVPYICKLSNADGHPLFCSGIDASVSSGLAVDSQGNAYVASTCAPDFQHICIEKLNPTGTAIAYRADVSGTLPAGFIAVDGLGNLYVVGLGFGILKLNASGTIIASTDLLGSELPSALAVDGGGTPQVIFQDSPIGAWRLRKYSADLSAILFDRPFLPNMIASVMGMTIDSTGITDVIGFTKTANLPAVHPTQSCHPYNPQQFGPTAGFAFLARFDAQGAVLQLTFLDVAFFPGGPILATPTGATALVISADGDVRALQLGPAPSEVMVSCIGDAATFSTTPIAPNEIVTLFGEGIGPADPLIGEPQANNLYPFLLGGTQITFDGIPAPLLYASTGQINLIAPHSLQGKTTTHVCAVANKSPTNCVDASVQPAAPAFFSSGVSGPSPFNLPYAAVVNQDGTINSKQNPAPAMSVVSLFATGLGTVTPSPPDGGITPYPSPTQDFSVSLTYSWINSAGASVFAPVFVLYAGPAPLEVEGLSQINMIVPSIFSAISDGPFIGIKVSSPDRKSFSSPGVTLWIK